MKFAILNDIHYGEERISNGVIRKFSNQSNNLVNNFIKNINNHKEVKLVLVLGDLIESKNEKVDRENLQYMKYKLDNLKQPIYYCIGNHEQRKLQRDKVKSILDLENGYYSFDMDDIHFIVLYSIEVPSSQTHEGFNYIDTKQVQWFENDLKNTNKKTIIFVHHSLSDQDLRGNPYFENKEQHCLIKNREEVREIIEKFNKVLCVFNSHIHWNRIDTHNKIPYITLQSLVENEYDKGISAEAYTIVDIDKHKIKVNIKGNYPKEYNFEM